MHFYLFILYILFDLFSFSLCLTTEFQLKNSLSPKNEHERENLNISRTIFKETLKFLDIHIFSNTTEQNEEKPKESFNFNISLNENQSNQTNKQEENFHLYEEIQTINTKISNLVTEIKYCFIDSEHNMGKRCFLVLILVILTIVICCLTLQAIIGFTKNCKMALNEIAARERKMGIMMERKK